MKTGMSTLQFTYLSVLTSYQNPIQNTNELRQCQVSVWEDLE